MTIWRMRIACWILKATNTHLQYVLLFAVPQQQWLQERASMLRCTAFPLLLLYPQRGSITEPLSIKQVILNSLCLKVSFGEDALMARDRSGNSHCYLE